MSKLVAPAVGLYHWSPTARRKSILRRGFIPGSKSLAGDWKPPYICFAATPHLAWDLSGSFHPEIVDWDLWMTWDSVPSGLEEITELWQDGRGHYVKEYRVYERIYKRDIWYVGSRTTKESMK